MVIVPVLNAEVWFWETVQLTVPLPVPLPVVTVIQSLSLVAVQPHALSTVTVILPVPPARWNNMLRGAMIGVQDPEAPRVNEAVIVCPADTLVKL